MAPRCLTITAAAQALSISRSHIYVLQRLGKLKTIKCGRRTLVPADSIEAFINAEIAKQSVQPIEATSD